MGQINELFRKRIGISESEKVTFGNIPNILEKTANTIPFENSSVLAKQSSDISEENIMEKVLMRNEGGVCYELNAALYFFFLENGLDVSLVRGVIYNQGWSITGRTHVAILLMHEGKSYLVDTGFGGNLPLRPVPLNGETVHSNNGEFRVKRMDTDHGNHILELKLKHKDPEWRIGYAFDTAHPVEHMRELNEVQTIIRQHPNSPFNKSRLITRLTDNGSITLTETSFTRWADGKVEKEEVDEKRFKEILNQYFG